MAEDLKGKRLLMTGAARGIGLGAARHFIEAGVKLFAVGRSQASLDGLAKEASGIEYHRLAVDVADPASALKIAQAVEGTWGGLDILVNNAAVYLADGGFSKEPIDMLERTIGVNLLAPHRLIKVLLPLLEKADKPKILNVSSEAGRLSSVDSKRHDPSYVLSKYSLNGLTRLWAHELKGRVAVNCMHPGWVQSDMGGPNAHDPLDVGGKRIFQAAAQDWDKTGQFWYGLDNMEW